MRILCSNKTDWKKQIETGFRFTEHTIEFDELSDNNIQNYDLIVPLTIPDLKWLNEKRHLVPDNPIPIPTLGCIQLCNDKYLFNQELIANGFSPLIPPMGNPLPFPYILKKKIDGWGQNSYIVTDAYQEQELVDLIHHPGYFTQMIIPGACEYATHILFKNQQIICSLTIKYGFESSTPIKGKDTIAYRGLSRCLYLDLFASILRFIGFDGICCFNFKVVDHVPMIFEINPRFGGSLCPYFAYFVEHLTLPARLPATMA
jgi:hypothetical protein